MYSTKIKVMFAEDDAMLTEIYNSKFEKAGYDVLVVRNLDALINEFKKFKPDFLFFDILFDGKKGYDVLKKVKKLPEAKNIVIAALTNLQSEESRREAIHAGAEIYLTKAETSLDKMISIMENKLKISFCPNCKEKVRMEKGKCMNCGK